MDQNHQQQIENGQNSSADFGRVPNPSESFRSVPHPSETFGTIPKGSEPFRTVPKVSARKENHTLSVRDAARMFEAAGVARTERSIVNWCQPNRMGIPRLDSYFDPNERKYYLTTESVERAIQEEMQKATRVNEPSEPTRNIRKSSETVNSAPEDSKSPRELQEIEREMNDLKIANRVKDAFIEQLRQEREGLVNHLVQSSRKVGELETRLLQLESPKNNSIESSN